MNIEPKRLTPERLEEVCRHVGAWRHDRSVKREAELLSHIAALDVELVDAIRLERERNETANVFMNQIKKLQDRIRELEQDKERLDWLEKDGSVMELATTGIPLKDWNTSLWNVRSAIDAARKEKV